MVCSAPYLPWLMDQTSVVPTPLARLQPHRVGPALLRLPVAGWRGSSLVISTPRYSMQAAITTLALSPMFLTRAG